VDGQREGEGLETCGAQGVEGRVLTASCYAPGERRKAVPSSACERGHALADSADEDNRPMCNGAGDEVLTQHQAEGGAGGFPGIAGADSTGADAHGRRAHHWRQGGRGLEDALREHRGSYHT
jgi:hypothetical protein